MFKSVHFAPTEDNPIQFLKHQTMYSLRDKCGFDLNALKFPVALPLTMSLPRMAKSSGGASLIATFPVGIISVMGKSRIKSQCQIIVFGL